ncbi:tyrosine-type recombinase/integrase [Celeribacter halophilus]|uniref:tyrosine-type recombinase/integrase n=1 Tax=Celeribacter halophilus TaxID=576117 RepID=UPI003A95385E
MKAHLTDALLRSIETPQKDRIEVSDTVRSGLRLRVYSSGRRTWLYEKRVKGGKKRKHTFGTYPEVSIKEARMLALEIEIESMRGIDRILEAEAAAKEKDEADRNAMSIADALDTFTNVHLVNLRTGDAVARSLRAAFAATSSQNMADLKRKDLQALIDAKAATGTKVMANRLKAYLSKFANFSFKRGYIADDIGRGLDKAIKEVSRDRFLSLDEMRQIWQATYVLSNLTGPLIRLLMLTAQRRSEIANLQWSEVDFENRCIVLNGPRTKNGNGHVTHLSKASIAELETRADLSQNSFVFSQTGKTPVSGFSKIKERIQKELPEHFEPWTFHDFRTAFATTMAELGEQEAVIDRILNHAASGSAPSAVARVYNRSQHLETRKRILEKWADLLIDERDERKVIPFSA